MNAVHLDPDLPGRLRSRLQAPLPGRRAQSQFEPDFSFGRHYPPYPTHARSAAVLVLLYRREGVWRLPLTVRPSTMAAHAGQISLPGGMVEPGETSQAAALRELDEELGIAGSDLEVLGALSPLYVFVSNYLVTPWLAWLPRPPQLVPHPREVAHAFELPLDQLLDPHNRGWHEYSHQGLSFNVPHLQIGPHQIWGATSMVLGELAAVVSETDG